MNYVRAGFEQISTAAKGLGKHETISLPEIIADQEGYILAYLSNENAEAATVFFDDFMVYSWENQCGECARLLPFGMVMRSSTRTASTSQNFLFNQGTGKTTFQGLEGKSFSTERIPELGVDMTKFRIYDSMSFS